MRAVIISLAVAIAILAGGLIWFAVSSLSDDTADDPFAPRFDEENLEGSAVDSEARIEIVRLTGLLERLQEEIDALKARMTQIENRPVVSPRAALPRDSNAPPQNVGDNDIIEHYAKVVNIAARRGVSGDINVASPRFLEEFLGRPRENLSDDCQPMTNPKLKEMLQVADVGPIRVTALEPAIESLRRVFEAVRVTDPDLYPLITSAGSLCVRQIRGTNGRTSTHSFGLAVDVNIDGRLDTFADGKTQLGLTILADFFVDEGWVWGAGFSREDSMHFEVSRQKMEQWRAEGKL